MVSTVDARAKSSGELSPNPVNTSLTTDKKASSRAAAAESPLRSSSPPRKRFEGQELGYLFLEDCGVFFTDDIDGIDDNDKQQLTNTWMDVEVPISAREIGMKHHDDEKSSSISLPDNVCPRCYLCLQLKRSNTGNSSSSSVAAAAASLCLINNGPRFDGTIQDARPNSKTCKCNCFQRSDAALMVGTALASHDQGHMTVRSIKLCRYFTNDHQDDDDDDVDDKAKRKLMKVAIVITFTCREIMRKDQKSRRRFITNSSKPFPSSTQLILSLIRSDWEELDAKMREYENPRSSGGLYNQQMKKPSGSFFPSKLSLNAIYDRIGGADLFLDNESVQENTTTNADSDNATKAVDITALPGDILSYRIASFLRARSIDSLRCTCKRLHFALQAVVPGLKLELYSHQIRSLVWMRRREATAIRETDLASIENQPALKRRINCKESDTHRAASGGGSVVLRCRETKEGVRVTQTNADELDIGHGEDIFSRAVARGGLLCDDPGLGKTITVLSLILQTMGLSTKCNDRVDIDSTDNDDDSEKKSGATSVDDRIFNEYWGDHIVPDLQKQALTKLFSNFLRSGGDVFHFFENNDPINNIIQNPISLKNIRQRIQSPGYDTFLAFETDVKLCFTNAMMNHPVDSVIHQSASRLNGVFIHTIKDFKETQIQTARKSFGRPSSKQNSRVAALVEQSIANKLKNALIPSSGTLLVVPNVLLDHWTEQIKLHLDPSYLTNKIPIIMEYSTTNESTLKMEEVMALCRVKKTHFPYLFVDKTGSKKLPTPFFLSMFKIVITTTQRFSNEWRNGSFENELRRQSACKSDIDDDEDDRLDKFRMNISKSEEACPLLKVNWLRLIVDEGHSMGKGKDNSSISFASWINAERRWAMTGTPTRQTMSHSGLSSILNLMSYLQHGFFTHRNGGSTVWSHLIVRGWNRGYFASFFRLRSLLSLLMVRHTKRDIVPEPIYKVNVLPMSLEEISTYNTLVGAIRSNLLITSMKGKTSGAQDSLLHKSQAKHAREAITNLRLVCVGGTQVLPQLSYKFYSEFLTLFDKGNQDEVKRKEVRKFISRATTGHLSSCDSCSMMLSTLLVFGCGHLVCTECAENTSNCCVVCDKEFDVDEFQRLQPGFVFEWLHNIEQEKKSRGSNGIQNGGDNDNPNEAPNPNGHTHRFGDGHECLFSPTNPNGICRLCGKEHEGCFLVDEGQCQVCYRYAEECPSSETKPHYIVNKLLRLYREQKDAKNLKTKNTMFSEFGDVNKKRPLKVIIFSQFRKVLNMTGDRLLRRFGNGCVAEYWGTFRKKELHKFINDDGCFCMLLGKDGSEGLDLSFVTHIIFLEQVWDKSLENQAVARAWRMGAKGRVSVETLIAQKSIEETMASLDKDLERGTFGSSNEIRGIRSIVEGNKASEYQRAKVSALLNSVKLITNSNTIAFGAGAKRKAAELNAKAAAAAGAEERKKRLTGATVRFQEQEQTYEYNIN
jgi:SNF2 family DNA or RNA helicase